MRTVSCRQGATLFELLLVLSLMVGFTAALHALVRLAAGQAHGALRRTAAGRDQLALWTLTTRELAHAEASDVTVPSTTTVEFDRPVAEGPVCASTPTSASVRSDHGGVLRLPVAGRDRFLAREPGAEGAWVGRGIVSVSVANCPDGRSAVVLVLDTPIPTVAFARIVEPVRLRSYPSMGAHALGLEGRGGGATIQPLAGPLDPTAFQATFSGNVLSVSLSRLPLTPLLLHLPLAMLP